VPGIYFPGTFGGNKLIKVNKQYHDGEVKFEDIPTLKSYPSQYPFDAAEIHSNKVCRFVKLLKERNPDWKVKEEKYFYCSKNTNSLVGGIVFSHVPEAKMDRHEASEELLPAMCFTSSAMTRSGFRVFYGVVNGDGDPAVMNEVKSGVVMKNHLDFHMEDHVHSWCRRTEKQMDGLWLMCKTIDYNVMTPDECYSVLGRVCSSPKSRSTSRIGEVAKTLRKDFMAEGQVRMFDFMFAYGRQTHKQPTYMQPELLWMFSNAIYEKYPQVV
jgi:hypothetical protein